MSLFTRARFGLARWLAKASSFSVVAPWFRAGVLRPSFHLLTREGYQKNAVVFACISALAFDYPEPPLRVYADESDGAPALDAHPLRRLLRRPNPIMGERELAMYTVAYAAIGGNAYWHKGRNSRGQVVQLWPYHAEQVSVVPGGETWVAGYTFHEADGSTTPIPAEDIVHFKWPSPDPHRPWQAQPPLMAAAYEVDSDNETTRYLRTLLRNDAIPRTVIRQSPERIMTDDEVRRAKAQFRSEYGGDGAGGVLILEAGAGVERLGLNLQELAFEALHRVPEQRIAGVLRVPLSVAGIGDDPTYANSEEAYRRYIQSTLSPLWALWGDEVQNSLADEYGVIARHDTSRVAALQEDVDAKWARVTAGYGQGLLGFREARAQLGIAGDPDPADLFVATLARELVPFAALAAPAPVETITVVEPRRLASPPDDDEPENAPAAPVADEPPPVCEVGTRARSRAAEAKSLRVARSLQRARGEVARRLEGRIAAAFESLADDAVRRARDAGKAQAKALPGLDDILPGGDWGLLAILRVGVVETLRASWELWNQALDVELAFDERDPAVVAALAQSGERITGITETTREAVRGLLEYGATNGWNIDELVEGDGERPGLRGLVEQTYRGRARTIARSELGTAQQTAAVARYEAAGVGRVLVLDNGFDDSDPRCTELNGTTQTLDWAKANPLQHPNCVRAFAPSFDD
ncbi:MAG: phage portal protein [Acidobacteria bacterium]|nr:phage portal protein [Acidobacteriota bacterium]